MMTDQPVQKPLTPRQKIFVEEYLRCWNASEAVRRAGYKSRANNAGARMLANVGIQKEITKRLKEFHMDTDEALKLLAEQARGDIAEVMDITGVGFNIDLKKAQEKGLTKLIRKVKQKTTTFIAKKESEEDREITEVEVELYDSQVAIDKILRVAGRYKDNLIDLDKVEQIIVTIKHND